MMKSIGFSNFRRFRYCPDLALSGVNYLVGKNNSGKTTFSLAARLAASFINQIETGGSFEAVFSFNFGDSISPKYSGYNSMLHAGENNGVIEFRIDYGDFEVSFGIGKKHNYFAFLKEQILDWVLDSYYSQYPDAEKGPVIDPVWLQTEIEKRRKDYQTKNPEKYQELLLKDRLGKGDVSYIRYYDKENRIQGEIDFNHSRTIIIFKDLPDPEQKEYERLSKIVSTLPEEDKPSALERIDEIDLIRESAEYRIESGQLTFRGLGHSKNKGLPVFWSIESLIENCLEGNKSGLVHSTFNPEEVSKQLAVKNRRERLKAFGESFSGRLYRQIPSASCHIGHFTDDEASNSILFNKYYELGIEKNKLLSRSLNKWISELEIGDSLAVRDNNDGHIECFVMSHTTINGDKHSYEVPFDYLGVGSRQLIILLINIAIVITEASSKDYPTLVTIEEPEQNIHPAIQSKLADMFLDFYLNYGCQCIIETHSEYIIRRSQVLVAEGIRTNSFTLGSNPLKVYYFPDNGSAPYDMSFKENGRFEKSFGQGFLDVAGKLNLNLLDLSASD